MTDTEVKMDVTMKMATEETPVFTWMADHIHKHDSKYRIAIDNVEYIRSTRRFRPAKLMKILRDKKPRVYKKVILSDAEKLKRKEYMLEYRIIKKAEVKRLQEEIYRLQSPTDDATSTDVSTTTTADDAK
jgi:hypothetical protein